MIVQVSHKESILHEWLEQAEEERSKIVTAACFCSNSIIAIGNSKGCRKLRTEENG